MNKNNIPDIVVSRLPIYLQKLNQFLREGREVVSSQEMADHLGVTATQIRKDLSNFGGFGKQGSGYNVISLISKLEDILNLKKIWKVVVIGAGNLGQALVHYQGFSRRGFEVELIFDNDPNLIGKEIAGIKIEDIADLEEMIKERGLQIAVLTVPAGSAQALTDRLTACGIKAILNYAPITLVAGDETQISNIDPVLKLQKMAYYL